MIALHPLAFALLLAGVDARKIAYDTKSADLSKFGGLYQSVFTNSTNKLYVTNAVGRRPVKSSDLIEIDPNTLAVVKSVVPPLDNAGGNLTQLEAVYGVGADEAQNIVWATNTRQDTVAYYNAKDLSLGNQYHSDIVKHARDVYIDTNTNIAWVGSSTSDIIAGFNKDKKDGAVERLNLTEKIGKPFVGVMSFVADEEAKVLYTVSLRNNLAAAVNLQTYDVKSWDLGNVKSPSGVAFDTKRKHLYITNQGTNNTLVLDPASGKIIKDFKTPAGPLNARYDPLYDVVYIANRLGHSVSVIDAEDYSTITELKVETPNHIALGPKGSIFVTDKSNSSLLYKFSPKEAAGNSTSSAAPSKTGGAGGAAGGAGSAAPSKTGGAGNAAGSAAPSKTGGAGNAAGSAAPSKTGAAGGAGGAKPSKSSAGSSVQVANAAARIGAPITVGAIAAVALLI